MLPSSSVSTIPRLLEAAREGRPEAIGELMDCFRGYLGILARVQLDKRLQGKVDPSDLVQETLMMAHRDFRSFQGMTEGELVHWMRSILAHVASNMIRHYLGAQCRDVRLERAIEEDLDKSQAVLAGFLVAPGDSPSQVVQQREQVLRLNDAMQKLPESYREVVIQHHLQGKSVAEVADSMGRSIDSVQKLRARAVIRLSQLLKEQ